MKLISLARQSTPNPPERRFSSFYVIIGILTTGCFLMLCVDWANSYMDDERESKRLSAGSYERKTNLPASNPIQHEQRNPRLSEPDFIRPSDTVRLRSIATICGKFCNDKVKAITLRPGTDEKVRLLPLSRRRCTALYEYPYMHMKRLGKPIRTIPPKLFSGFTMHKTTKLRYKYKSGKALIKNRKWTKSMITYLMDQLENEEFIGPYGEMASSELLALFEYLRMQTKRVLVLDGGGQPWVESVALFSGAPEVSVVGNEKIECDDDRVKVYTHNEFAKRNVKKRFDVVVSYNTVQGAGLGGMGEELNPWEDLITLAKLWCVTKKDSFLVLKVPRSKKDWLVFNSYRVYGPKRLRLLTTNWAQMIDDHENSWDWQLPIYGKNSRVMLFSRID